MDASIPAEFLYALSVEELDALLYDTLKYFR